MKAFVLAKAFYSSGDVIADRRADYARMLDDAGDHAAAADLMAQAMDMVPLWAAGWDLLGQLHEKAGNVAGAIAAWRQLEALDDHGVFGARLKLAAHDAGPAGEGTAVGYVEALFDQYAPQFEQALVGKLGYRVPELLDGLVAAEMNRLGLARFERALDLGCGTGLMGERLRAKVDFLEGVDISAAMIAETARKKLYDGLHKGELVATLNARRADADLVTAADVLIYCGALQPVLTALVPALRAGGLVAFSLEAHDGEEELFLRPSLRYAHGVEATRNILLASGLDILRYETAILRFDRGAPITGILVVARKPVLELAAANDGDAGGDVAA
ncbi:MAG: methyltransferase [Devosia sp.]|uniref:class I SAM-dependent DNA methyltransferase n=1 Tax=Devosia sp. TaxID=1871048 RepID=UPI0024CA4D31|nr:methyltransferase [Devosia sp.]UYO00964.1 MAG: methyltransferase [Devosia sp.]